MLSALRRRPCPMTNLLEVTEQPLPGSKRDSFEEVQPWRATRFSERILAIHRTVSFSELSALKSDERDIDMVDWERRGVRQHAELRWSKVADRRVIRPKEARTLTPQEHAVLRGMARGLTDAQIAEVLGIARRTVCKHVEAIYRKLGVETRTAAAQVCKGWNEG